MRVGRADVLAAVLLGLEPDDVAGLHLHVALLVSVDQPALDELRVYMTLSG
jgi:hypothetical protein